MRENTDQKNLLKLTITIHRFLYLLTINLFFLSFCPHYSFICFLIHLAIYLFLFVLLRLEIRKLLVKREK